jgi:hypothetical protein
MSITNTDIKVTYSCDSATTSFAITFAYDADVDSIEVWLKDTIFGTETLLSAGLYTISGLNIVTSTTYGVTKELTIKRVVAHTQQSAYEYKIPLESHILERDFDKLVKQVQGLAEQLGRVPMLSVLSDYSNPALGAPSDGYYLRWNSDGDLETVLPMDVGDVAVSAFMEDFLAAQSIAEARVDLGADSAWHVIGNSGEPAFENSWVNVGGVYGAMAYRLDTNGVVHLKGRVTGGVANSVICTLPSAYRPAATQGFGIAAEDSGYVSINTSGEIRIVQ